MPTPSPLPLEGIRVLEFSHMVMGPTCGMILADFGAEVIKVEPPGGDKTRTLVGAGIGFFRNFNRNKKSVVLDMASTADRQSAAELAGSCDVVLENFRPGLMQSWGLDYANLSQRYPHLIYVSHKGFLPGPYENRLALDEVVQMMGGLSYMTGPAGRPLRAGASVNDIMGGMFGALGVFAALRAREHTGRGQEVRSALFENCVFLSSQHMQQYLMTGEAPPPMPACVSAWSVYDIFTLTDDAQLFIAAVSDKQFRALCLVLECPEWLERPEYASNTQRVAVRAQLLTELRAVLCHHHVEALIPKLQAAGIPYAPITRPDQLLDDPHLRQSGALAPMTAEDGSTTDTVLLPLMMGGKRFGARMPLPKVGEHTRAVLAQLQNQHTPPGAAALRPSKET